MEYMKATNGSYMHNCLVVRRESDPEMTIVNGSTDNVSVSLNGYAIIPIEDYFKLKGEGSDLTMAKVKKVSRELHG